MHDATVVGLPRSARYLRQVGTRPAAGPHGSRRSPMRCRVPMNLTNEPDPTVGGATERGLLDWDSIAA
jgi:hypothetical protein